jgi:hypothetical protein
VGNANRRDSNHSSQRMWIASFGLSPKTSPVPRSLSSKRKPNQSRRVIAR